MRRLLVITAGAALALLAATSVLGHAKLISSDPPDGGTLTTTPYTLTATFDEELAEAGSLIAVKNSAGVDIATGGLSPDNDKVMTAELPSLPAGEYVARWTAVTADDQAVERGTFTFTVGSAPAPSPAPGSPPATGSNDVLIALALAAVVVGGVVAYLFFRNRR